MDVLYTFTARSGEDGGGEREEWEEEGEAVEEVAVEGEGGGGAMA
jgi:hypothetical protein